MNRRHHATGLAIADDEITCTSAVLPPGAADKLYASDRGTRNFGGIDDIKALFTMIDECRSAETIGHYIDTFGQEFSAFADNLESCGIAGPVRAVIEHGDGDS